MRIKRILISQPAPEKEKNPYSELSEKHGLIIDFRQFTRVEGIPLKEFRKERIDLIGYGAVIFTSRSAIDNYFRLCEESRLKVPITIKYICTSEAIAFYLQKYIVYRKRKISFGNGRFDDLIKLIMKNKGERFLVPISDIHNQEIPQKLESLGIKFQSVILHRTVSADLSDLNISIYDILVFFSPAGVKSLQENFPDFEQGDKKIGAFGPITCAAVRESELTLNIEAPTQTAPSMAVAIDKFIIEYNKKRALEKQMLNNETVKSEGDTVKTDNDAVKTEDDAVKSGDDTVILESDTEKSENETEKSENETEKIEPDSDNSTQIPI